MKYLEHTVDAKVRFSEVDSLRVVWHGNYLKYFEDGREAFGLHYGMSYLELHAHGVVQPLVKMDMDFKSVVRYGDLISITTRLIYTKAAKVIFEYEVFNKTTGLVGAVGQSIQVFVDENMELQLFAPPVYDEWKKNLPWKEK